MSESESGGNAAWRCVKSSTVYENDWIQVNHQDVLTPGGTAGIYGVVHFKHIAVGVVAIDSNDNVLLVGQHRYPLNAISWEIPEGGCKVQRELPLDCARRELREETGFVASQWEPLLSLHLSNSVTDERAQVFLAGGLSDTGVLQREASETDMRVRRVPLKQAVAMIDAGEITDAISVAALLKVANRQCAR